jgi:hypothetical protein
VVEMRRTFHDTVVAENARLPCLRPYNRCSCAECRECRDNEK